MSVGILVLCRREKSLDTDYIDADMTETKTEGTKCGIADDIGEVALFCALKLYSQETIQRQM